MRCGFDGGEVFDVEDRGEERGRHDAEYQGTGDRCAGEAGGCDHIVESMRRACSDCLVSRRSGHRSMTDSGKMKEAGRLVTWPSTCNS